MKFLSRRILALCILATCAASATAQSAPLADLDAYITKAMADWQVPGLSIAVVRNDSVICLLYTSDAADE